VTWNFSFFYITCNSCSRKISGDERICVLLPGLITLTNNLWRDNLSPTYLDLQKLLHGGLPAGTIPRLKNLDSARTGCTATAFCPIPAGRYGAITCRKINLTMIVRLPACPDHTAAKCHDHSMI
jgi:hypothetical protein